MSKVYIAVTDTEQATHGCVVDFEALPKNSIKKTANPWEQGTLIGEWLKADIRRATLVIDDISRKCFEKDSQGFIDRVVRLGISLQKAASPNRPMDALITFVAQNDQLDFLFTSPASAYLAYTQVMNGI